MKTSLKRWFTAALAVALLSVAPSAFAQTTGAYYYWWQAVDEGGVTYAGQNVRCTVYRPNVHAGVLLHTSSALTNVAPLVSDANGRLHFYSSSNDPVDVQCYYDYGGGGFTGRLRTTDHKIIIPRQGTQISRFSVSTSAATYQSDSGIVLPAGAVVRDVIIQNLNPLGLGTYHLSVGFLGNHAVATSVALAQIQALNSPDEWLRPHMVVTGGSAGGFTTWVSHRGTALQLAHGAAAGFFIERSYLIHVATGLGVSYSAQPGSKLAAGSNFVVAHVFVLWQKLHSSANKLPFGLGQ